MEAQSEHPRDPYYDVPSGIMSAVPDLTALEVKCDLGPLPPTRPRTITCSFHQTFIDRPSPQKIEDRIKEIENAFKQPHVKQKFARMISSGCGKEERGKFAPHMAASERTYWQRLWKACDDKKLDDWRDAEIAKLRDVDAHTCELSPNTFEYEFVQQDQDTWVSSQTMKTECKHTLTLTLWRKKGDTVFWNFRQVRSVPPNAKSELLPGMCEQMAKTPVMDFKWDNRTLRDAGCTYFRL